MAVPNTFVDLAAAHSANADTFVNIIGVVVDIMPVTQTKIAQYMITFKLLDTHLRDSVWGPAAGLTVRFFKGDIQSLPRIRGHGDIVLIRNIKMTSHANQVIALSNYQTKVAVVPEASIPAPNFELAFQGKQRLECLGAPIDSQITLQEQKYIIQLKDDMNDTLADLRTRLAEREARKFDPAQDMSLPPNVPTGPAALNKRPGDQLVAPMDVKKMKTGGVDKFKLIREINPQPLQWADLCVQVVRKYSNNFGECELYVTDHTENREMWHYAPPEDDEEHTRDGDRFNYAGGGSKAPFDGPYGWLVLKINVKEPHATFASRELSEGDFVWLSNVKFRASGSLEGYLWPDDLSPDRIHIRRIKDLNVPEVGVILERKQLYEKMRMKATTKPANGVQDGQEKKKLSKNEKKKAKKLQAKQSAAQKTNPRDNPPDAATTFAVRGDINPHIRCSHEDVPISSIREILDPTNEMHSWSTPEGHAYIQPFMNAQYRARVRVVDFKPKTLQDFAVDDLPTSLTGGGSSPPLEFAPKYNWSFALLLEDASKPKDASNDEEYRVWAGVAHQDAQYLFGNDVEDPDEVRGDARLLAKLREKLCILWGNLEERDEGELLSNRPFECCVKEGGVERDAGDPGWMEGAPGFGFKRVYNMFGVTIL